MPWNGPKTWNPSARAKFASIPSTPTAKKTGYELRLTRMVSEAVTIPVIASGGAGSPEHMADAVTEGKASAALIASIVHYGEYTIRQCKDVMAARGIKVRQVW